MVVQPIDLLSIQDNDLRRKKYEEILKDSEEHKRLLLESYMKLAEKNQTGDYKKYTRFLKIFTS
jgi:hypothetical protein